jgi:RNA polymerase sigma-70 factor (ECF subfamily)
MPDAQPFLEALRPHYDDALRYCRALCAGWSPDEAEDVLHDALLRALERFDQLRDLAAFRPWLFRIVTRCHHTARRRRFWRRLVPLDAAGEDAPVIYERGEPDPEVRVLLRALAQLPERDRAALLLFKVVGLSTAEVAEVQGDRSRSAVKSRLSRARARLRAALAADGRGAGDLHPEPSRPLYEQAAALLNTLPDPPTM